MNPKQFHKALKASFLAGWNQWTQTMVPLCLSETGISALIADDTVLGHPSGRVLPFAKCLHHGASHRVVFSQNLVALAWTDGRRVILLGLRPWEPNSGISKHQILREMLDEVIACGLGAQWLLFDGWYLTPDLVLWCLEQRIHWASRLRRDRLVETEEGALDERWQYRTDELAAGFAEAQYRWYPQFRKYAKGVEVTTNLTPQPLRIAMVKDHYHDNLDKMRFWVCSAPVDVPTILRLTKLRWGVEVVFRYLKQHLRVEKCIIRTPHIIRIWWSLIWTAFNRVAELQDTDRNWASAKLHLLTRRKPHATMFPGLAVA